MRPIHFHKLVAQLLAASMIVLGTVPALGMLDASPAHAATPNVVDWSSKQTSIKNQSSRTTCGSFAIVAAIEARYKRDFGLTLDLSEEYFHHLEKSTRTTDGTRVAETGTSYYGGSSPKEVVWAQTYALPTETDAPYFKSTDAIEAAVPEAAGITAFPYQSIPQANIDAFEYAETHIPLAARANAKYGVLSFSTMSSVKSSSVVEAKLAAGKDVIANFVTDWQYDDEDDRYEYVNEDDGAQHIVLIVGYDRPNREYIVKNSWGGTGTIRVTYEVFEKGGLSGATVDTVRNPTTNSYSARRGRFLGTWDIDLAGERGTLTINRVPGDATSATTPAHLGHYQLGTGISRAVNGYWTGGGRALVFTIAPPAKPHPAKNAMVGSQVVLYAFNNDGALHGAGTYKPFYNNIVSAAVATRRGHRTLHFPSVVFGRGEWQGTWDVNHDGRRGTLKLKVNSVGVSGTYTPVGGTARVVIGTFGADGSDLNISIHKGGSLERRFQVHYFESENDVAAGVEIVGGLHYGVYLNRHQQNASLVV
jgi:hypothetical protein